MSPRWPRRARRRTRTRRVILLVAAVILLALLVGGLTQVARQSQAYDADSNRTLAAQGAVLADQSNATSRTVRTLLEDLPTMARQSLQAALDGAVRQTAAESQQAGVATGNTPAGSPGSELTTVFSERAQSMEDLRGALDGLLGMVPSAVTGAPASRTVPLPGPAASLSASEAANRITAAGALLSRSDALYGSVRRTLATSAGHARLPGSVWVTDPRVWQAGSVAALVDQVATSPTLEPSHYVVLRTVRLTPPVLPPVSGAPAGVAVLSPTTQVGVTAVLADQGAATEPVVRTTFSLAPQASGATVTKTETTALGLGGSVTLPTVLFAVAPGKSYVLTVQIVLPPGQVLTDGTVYQPTLRVSPAT